VIYSVQGDVIYSKLESEVALSKALHHHVSGTEGTVIVAEK
jgi:hypothetical protein